MGGDVEGCMEVWKFFIFTVPVGSLFVVSQSKAIEIQSTARALAPFFVKKIGNRESVFLFHFRRLFVFSRKVLLQQAHFSSPPMQNKKQKMTQQIEIGYWKVRQTQRRTCWGCLHLSEQARARAKSNSIPDRSIDVSTQPMVFILFSRQQRAFSSQSPPPLISIHTTHTPHSYVPTRKQRWRHRVRRQQQQAPRYTVASIVSASILPSIRLKTTPLFLFPPHHHRHRFAGSRRRCG